VDRRWYKLRADLVGSYVLPPVVVRYRATRASEERAAGDSAVQKPPRASEDSSAEGPERAAEDSVVQKPPRASKDSSAEGPPRASEDSSAEGPERAANDAATARPTDWTELKTSEIFIEVESVLPSDGQATDIRDIKAVTRVQRGLPWWVWAAGGVSLAALATVVILLAVRRKRELVVPPPPAHEVAYAALDALRQTDFGNLEAVRLYYFRISEVLRAYIEGRFYLNATDLTTEEILGRLVELPRLGDNQRASLREFLEGTDRVKFAEHRPSSEEIESTYEHALRFVETTVEAPAATEGAVS
jgi:hypothetical protein